MFGNIIDLKFPAARFWQNRARLQDLDRIRSQALTTEGLAAKI